MKIVQDFIKEPVTNLDVSESFKATCKKMEFERLIDIVELAPERLIHRDGFTFHWLAELIGFLTERDALGYLQPGLTMGNICGQSG